MVMGKSGIVSMKNNILKKFKIEKANASLDRFRASLVIFETSHINVISLHYLAFSILF